MKAFDESRPHKRDGLASSFSLSEKLIVHATVTDRRYNNHDEHSQTGILTSDVTLLPPSHPIPRLRDRTVALGVRNPLQWRNRPRFSRGSLSCDCVSDGQRVHHFQRTCSSYASEALSPSKIFI